MVRRTTRYFLANSGFNPMFQDFCESRGEPYLPADPKTIRASIGATQDLPALDIDLAAITQAGGWKSTRTPLHYAEKINTARSGMARAAEKSGRDLIRK
jgi:hypothetical protein